MAEQHLYLAVQRQNLGDSNWADLIAALQAKGQHNDGDNPNLINHWRVSLDELFQIFEAAFEGANIDVDWFTNWLANEFGVDPLDIGEVTGYNQYGRFSTYSYPAGVTNRFRIGVLGFVQGQGWPSHEESRLTTVQYITNNQSNWDIDI